MIQPDVGQVWRDKDHREAARNRHCMVMRLWAKDGKSYAVMVGVHKQGNDWVQHHDRRTTRVSFEGLNQRWERVP